MKYLKNVNLKDFMDDLTKPVLYITDNGIVNPEHFESLTPDQLEVLDELKEHDLEIERFLRDKGLAA